MEIRSVTLFSEPNEDPRAYRPFLERAREAFTCPVQSLRLATPPFPDWWGAPRPDSHQLDRTMRRWQEVGIDYIGLGPVRLRHKREWLALIPHLAGANGLVFVTAEIADDSGLVDVERCRSAAALMRELSGARPDGFGNLYFGALAGCSAGAPFLPAAFHEGGPPHFALAMEAADLAVTAFSGAESLAQARDRLVAAIEREAAALVESAHRLAERFQLRFSGIDFTLAPYPEPRRSLGAALEKLGLAAVGQPGSLFASAFVADCLDRAHFPRCGFSGLMLPVLEDATLAARAAEGLLTIGDLVGYAAVCGTGLDTIPLPGDVPEEALAGLLLDLAGLSARAGKPLTARLLPLPGLKTGDPATFTFPYFANSSVMDVGLGVSGPLLGDEHLELRRLHGSTDIDGR